MGLLSKLKSVLGLGSDDDERVGRQSDDVGVTVEREREDADPANEAAVKGVDESDDEPADETDEQSADEESTDADETVDEADESDAEEGDEVAEEEESETAEEDEEAAEFEETDAESEDDAIEEAAEAEVDESDAEADESDAEADESDAEADDAAEAADEEGGVEALQDIKGIGPAYAERLVEVGITSVAALAEADHEAVAEEADLAPGRVEGWVERAKARQ